MLKIFTPVLSHAVLHESLAKVAGLQLSNERAAVVFSMDFPRELRVLLDLHRIKPPEGENSEPPSEHEIERWRGRKTVLVDALGRYFPRERKVEMYTRAIRYASHSLGIDEGILTEIVLAHEIAHGVTHFGKGKGTCGTIWQDFENASTEDKELLAQLLPHILFQRLGMTEHLKAMEELARHQAPAYNAYQKHQNDPPASVKRLVQAVRPNLPGKDEPALGTLDPEELTFGYE